MRITSLTKQTLSNLNRCLLHKKMKRLMKCQVIIKDKVEMILMSTPTSTIVANNHHQKNDKTYKINSMKTMNQMELVGQMPKAQMVRTKSQSTQKMQLQQLKKSIRKDLMDLVIYNNRWLMDLKVMKMMNQQMKLLVLSQMGTKHRCNNKLQQLAVISMVKKTMTKMKKKVWIKKIKIWKEKAYKMKCKFTPI